MCTEFRNIEKKPFVKLPVVMSIYKITFMMCF